MPVKPKYVKEVGNKILERYGKRVPNEFSKNKELVEELTSVKSKTVRNRIAGYLTSKQHSNTSNSENQYE